MTETFYKATRPNGTDFYTGTIDYAKALETGEPITLPTVDDPMCCTNTVLHASRYAGSTLSGGSWPCRLFEVTGEPVASRGSKRGFFSLTVQRELPGYLALGPQGVHVTALIERAGRLTEAEAEMLDDPDGDDAWFAAWGTAWTAAFDAAMTTYRASYMAAGRAAAMNASRTVAGDVARALVLRDLIGQYSFTQDHYDRLISPWAQTIGKVHPDD